MLRDGNWDIWVYDLERGVATRITFGAGYDADPAWSPDGRWLAFASDRDGDMTVFRKRSDGSGQAELLLDPEVLTEPVPELLVPRRPVADGQPDRPGGQRPVGIPVGGEGEAEALWRRRTPRSSGPFRRMARWIAYESDESGRLEVYVGSFPSGGGKWQISDEGGSQPVWSRDGRRLYYRTDGGIMMADVDAVGETFRAGKPRPAITGTYVGGLGGVQAGNYFFSDYDVAPDGSFVLFSGDEMPEGVTTAKLVTGWFSELQRLTTATGK